ncbi:MAG: SDR family oxidoreductase [bacterium]|nr:SDR family oxidoreductase [bacterium]
MASSTFLENVVVITGASAGIGRQAALQLADEGAHLSLAARHEEPLHEVADACRRRGGRALAVPTDVSDKDPCRRLIDRTIGEYGRLDTLINNAGITMWTRFDEIQDLGPIERIMQVNYFGSVYCTHYALPHLKKTRGRIVGISSLTGKTGVPTRTGYAASKHAMAGFFDSLRIELAESGVSVTMVYPGFVSTGIRERAFGPDGQPIERSPVRESEVMSSEECARWIVKAAAQRKRELIMTFRGKLGLWLKLISPGLVDRIAQRAIEKGR